MFGMSPIQNGHHSLSTRRNTQVALTQPAVEDLQHILWEPTQLVRFEIVDNVILQVWLKQL